MDTPDKGKLAAPSVSNFEDSPVFRFIDSLSPINPVKPVHGARILNSPALPSPSFLFPSPQISSSRFCARRHDSPNDSNVDVHGLGNENTGEEATEIVHQSKPLDETLDTPSSDVSAVDVTTEWHGEHLDLDLKAELPKSLRYENKRPDGNLLPWNKMAKDKKFRVAGSQEGRIHHYEGGSSNEKWSSCESEINLHSIKNIEQLEEYSESDVLQRVCNIADQLYSSSSKLYDDSEDDNEIKPEDGTNSEMFLDLKQFNTAYLKDLGPGCQIVALGQCDTEVKPEQTPAILSTSTSLSDKLAVSTKVEMGGMQENSNSEHSALRRCLLFDTVGVCKRKTAQISKPKSSASLGIDEEIANNVKHLVPIVGLHLNSLGTASQGDSSDRNMNADANQLIASENSPQLTHVDEVDDNKSRKKRSKVEPFQEALSCKRCNCKRSKCLKLYCDCFAAGLYCIEPCSCQDCFNKPIHEKTVLETRKLIESRNPLAFAPKVIRSETIDSDSVKETNKTPASARHKRGCNCKKSSCLKKYCECFQGGVGCSSNCRCEGCQNSFGQKDETDGADAEDWKPQEKTNSCDYLNNKEEECPESSVPPEISRPLIRLRGSFLHLVGQHLLPTPVPKHKTCPEDEAVEVVKPEGPTHSKVKSNSPNSKRVSPPHHETISTSKGSLKGRKLILRSVPPFPSLSPSSKE